MKTVDEIAFVSTFPPRQCGIATFTNSLIRACRQRIDRRLELSVIAVDKPELGLIYPETVKHNIDRDGRAEYVKAAKIINYCNVRVVSIQHEFGIFGGPDGKYILDFARELHRPLISTFHTILDEPSEGQRMVTEELIELSHRVVVMSKKGMEFLRDIYKAPREKLEFIPHGVDHLPLVEPEHYKEQFDLAGKWILLTFGLLSEGKGIEDMIWALPPIVKKHPNLRYVILGATHPEIVKREGEKYRVHLQRLTIELGLERNVLFIDRFVEQRELGEFLKAADIYVTPYPNRKQITSGTLAYALGAGKPIVSTNYWYAEELLDAGRGILVDVRDSEALSQSILGLLDDHARLRSMRSKAYEFSRDMVWPKVGQRYVDIFRAAMDSGHVRPHSHKMQPYTGLPKPKLTHLQTLTDDTGLFQHAFHVLPDPKHGYTTDDNARALVVAAKFNYLLNDSEAVKLIGIYLRFLHLAQRQDGLFHNFMSYDRRFLDQTSSEDCFGRSLWGLGYVMNKGPEKFIQPAAEILENALKGGDKRLEVLNPRGRANAILGLYYYLKCYPEAHDLEGKIDIMASKNLALFRHHSDKTWKWFEPVISYDNAILPQSMFLAFDVTGEKEYLNVAVESLDFLIEACWKDGHLSLVGSEGWYRKGGEPARFDQQPIDACRLVEALKAAFNSLGERRYLRYMRSTFDWFLGANDLEESLYDFSTGGCADGLTCEGASCNQGAESTLCFLLSLLTVMEI